MPDQRNPLIFALVDDLFFVSRIESTVRQLEFEIQFIEKLASEDACRKFVEVVAAKSPVLILIDLNIKSFPWAECVPVIKTSPQISQIPMLAFGSHKDVQMMTRAKEVGIDVVLAKSRFSEAMGELIEKHARKDG